MLALGTSLAGVYSDRVVVKAAERFWKGREEGGGWGEGPRVVESPSPKDKGGFLPTAPNYCPSSSSSTPSISSSSLPKAQQHLGAVIINLQHTRLDPYTSLRIYGKLDEVFALLTEELSLPAIPSSFSHTLSPSSSSSSPFVFEVPYDEEGFLSESKKTIWDLRQGKEVKLTAGPGEGFVGRIFSVPSPSDGACPIFCVELPCTQNECLRCVPKKYILGYWWVNEAVKGAVPRLPFVSVVEG